MRIPETTWGYALKTFLYALLAGALCFFLHMSITMALSIAATEKLGVRTGGALEDGRTLVVEDYLATDSAPAHRNAYIVDAAGNETSLIDRDVLAGEAEVQARAADEELLATYPITRGYSENIRSAIDPGTRRFSNWVAQILMLILFLAFPYSTMWYLGDHDRNAVQFGHMKKNVLRGALIGALADVPAALAWVGLLIGKLGGTFFGYVQYYRYANVCFWPYFNHFIPAGIKDPAGVAWGSVVAMLPILLSLPLITGIGYWLGFSEFSLRDRLLYATTGKHMKKMKK